MVFFWRWNARRFGKDLAEYGSTGESFGVDSNDTAEIESLVPLGEKTCMPSGAALANNVVGKVLALTFSERPDEARPLDRPAHG
jgi:hypothetical protein